MSLDPGSRKEGQTSAPNEFSVPAPYCVHLRRTVNKFVFNSIQRYQESEESRRGCLIPTLSALCIRKIYLMDNSFDCLDILEESEQLSNHPEPSVRLAWRVTQNAYWKKVHKELHFLFLKNTAFYAESGFWLNGEFSRLASWV